MDDYVCEHTFEDLRVTLINKNGTVIYDNLEKDPSHFENHHNRQEIKEAITYGSGYSINRQSESLGGEFFYSAKYYPNLDYAIIPELTAASAPNIDSLKKFIPSDELWPMGPSWGYHAADIDVLKKSEL